MTQNVRLERPWGNGRIVWIRDAVADDSDKTWTVPTGKLWDLISVEATLVASATVGTRILILTVSNGAALVHASMYASPTASQRSSIYIHQGGDQTTSNRYGLGVLGNNAATNDTLPMPFLLPAGYIVRVYDLGAVDAAADDMTVALQYLEYDV